MKTTRSMLLTALLFVAAGTIAFAQEERQAPGKEEQKITFEMLVNQYNFPVKPQTGNPDQDYIAYKKAKDKWISEHQELYRQYNAQGEQKKPAPRSARKDVSGLKKQ